MIDDMQPDTEPLRSRLADPVREVDLQEVWRGVAHKRARGSRWSTLNTAPIRWTAGAVALAAAAALFITYAGGETPGPLRRADGATLLAEDLQAGADESSSLALSDGSTLVIEPGTDAQVLENTDRAFEVLLAKGLMRFEVEPGGERRWSIETGLARVEVVGTVFEVDRREDSVRVAVDRGVVLVRAASLENGVRRLVAGQSLEIVREVEEPALEAGEPIEAEATEASAAEVDEVAEVATQRPHSRRESDWVRHADEGDFNSAYAELGSAGITRELARTRSVEQLWRLADVARWSGHPVDAVQPLEEIITNHRADSRASLAAFTLGGIQLRNLRRPRRAAAAFQRSLDMGLAAGLREDARARLVEAYSRAGMRRQANAAAANYASEFPGGRHSAAITAWLQD